jgi:hypothetical protein
LLIALKDLFIILLEVNKMDMEKIKNNEILILLKNIQSLTNINIKPLKEKSLQLSTLNKDMYMINNFVNEILILNGGK